MVESAQCELSWFERNKAKFDRLLLDRKERERERERKGPKRSQEVFDQASLKLGSTWNERLKNIY